MIHHRLRGVLKSVWVLITEITDISANQWVNGVFRDFSFTNSFNARYWRFEFGSVTNNGGYKSLTEWGLYYDGSNQSLNGKVITNIGDSFSFGGVSNLNNNNLAGGDIAAVTEGSEFDVYVDLGSSKVVTKYRLAPQYTSSLYYNTPGSFKVYAANSLS
jgi:hypothetical protein